MDLAIRNGVVVTPEGRRRADVGVEHGRVAAVGTVAPAAEEIDASDRLVLPGAIDVHTHMRLPADEEPDRFWTDTVAAAFGGTTTLLSFAEQPRGGSLRETLERWREGTRGESAVDFGFHLIVTDYSDRARRELPGVIEAGCPTFKAFMVYDELRIEDRDLFALLRQTAGHGGMMMVHCENQIVLSARIEESIGSGRTAPRHHADTRPPMVEAEATHRAICLAEMARAPLYVVHLSCAGALRHLAHARARGGPVYAETCPHYLTLTSERYRGDDREDARYVISPPLREPEDCEALWGALADGTLDLVGSDHVPLRLEGEKFDHLASFATMPNGAPGIETMPSLVYDEGVAGERLSLERMVELVSSAPARLFGLADKGAIAPGKDADLVLWDPGANRVLSQADLHHRSDYTPYEGRPMRGAPVATFVRGRPVVRDGRFVGERGWGRFVERRLGAGVAATAVLAASLAALAPAGSVRAAPASLLAESARVLAHPPQRISFDGEAVVVRAERATFRLEGDGDEWSVRAQANALPPLDERPSVAVYADTLEPDALYRFRSAVEGGEARLEIWRREAGDSVRIARLALYDARAAARLWIHELRHAIPGLLERDLRARAVVAPPRVAHAYADGRFLWLAIAHRSRGDTLGVGSVVRLDRETGETELYQPLEIATLSVHRLASAGGYLWLATREHAGPHLGPGAGLVRLDTVTRRAVVVEPANAPLTGRLITDLRARGPALWIATDAGIHRFDPAEEAWRAWRLETEVALERATPASAVPGDGGSERLQPGRYPVVAASADSFLVRVRRGSEGWYPREELALRERLGFGDDVYLLIAGGPFAPAPLVVRAEPDSASPVAALVYRAPLERLPLVTPEGWQRVRVRYAWIAREGLEPVLRLRAAGSSRPIGG